MQLDFNLHRLSLTNKTSIFSFLSVSVSVGGSVRWRFVWIRSERWTITTEGGVGDDYADLAKIHRQWWLFVRICFVIKKLISTGSISASISVFLCAGFASCVCFVHTGHFEFVFSSKNKIGSSFTLTILKPTLKIKVTPKIMTFRLHLTTGGNESRVPWCLRWLLNTVSNIHVLTHSTLCIVQHVGG